jgi:hypothetical protein
MMITQNILHEIQCMAISYFFLYEELMPKICLHLSVIHRFLQPIPNKYNVTYSHNVEVHNDHYYIVQS